MRFLIIQDKQGTPCMELLPAKEDKEIAQAHVDRMNKVVQENNLKYEEFRNKLADGYKPRHGEVFLYRKDSRIFSIKEID